MDFYRYTLIASPPRPSICRCPSFQVLQSCCGLSTFSGPLLTSGKVLATAWILGNVRISGGGGGGSQQDCPALPLQRTWLN